MDFDTEPPMEQIEAEKRKKGEGGREGGELHTSQINLKFLRTESLTLATN